MKQAVRTLAILLAAVFVAGPGIARASETDALINKLIEKKILTSEEAQEIRNEMAGEAASAADGRAAEIKEVVKKMPGGSWLSTVKWAGDLRIRHEDQFKNTAATSEDRHRDRFRLRFGLTAKPIDPLEIGVKLGTGASGDPLSNNQSFTGTFDKKAIFVDLAYAQYSPWSWLSAVGGKMANPFKSTDMMWDPDVTPEGGALLWKSPTAVPGLSDLLPVKPFANLGIFTITENPTAQDPAIMAAQGGAEVELPFGGWKWEPSVAFYGFTGIKGKATSGVTGAPAGNSTVGASFRYGYSILDVLNTVKVGEIMEQPVSFYGDYIRNNGATDNKTAWEAGAKVGKVTEKLGSWEAFYFYERKENDAVFGALTDSDFGAGGTNHKGHAFGLQVGLNKYMSAGVKYLRTDEINGTQNQNNTLQVDLQTQW